MPQTARSSALPECPISPAEALAQASRGLVGAVLAFSALVNLLMLTGPFFMMQVYDRVLPGRSEATLVALLGLTGFLYAIMVVLDHARARLVARLGARLTLQLEAPVFGAVQRLERRLPGDAGARVAVSDLDVLQRWLASPVFLALFDAPWVPAYMALIFLLHPTLGWVALAGAGVLLALAACSQVAVRARLARAADRAALAEQLGDSFRAEAGPIAALGMTGAACARWSGVRAAAHAATLEAADRASIFAAATRGLRLFLQSAMLAAGAWLVLRGALGPGAMIAASIILGRALAPIEQAVGQWGTIQAAWAGWYRLSALLRADSPPPAPIRLRHPDGSLTVENLVVVPPGEMRATLREVSFALPAGRVLGVIGPGGAGKSTLAKALTGAWPAVAGRVRLGGFAVPALGPDGAGPTVGYLPQGVTLFAGTVADNIARLAPEPDMDAVVAAARAAGAHETVLSLPQGYETRIAPGRAGLAGGQVQRIGLARALYGAPALVVLDEPDAHLDSEGLAALGAAIRALKAGGTTVVIVAHRASVLAACDDLLVLDGGRTVAQGPRSRILGDPRLLRGALGPVEGDARSTSAAPP